MQISFFHMVHESYMTDCLGEEVSKMLTGKIISPHDPEDLLECCYLPSELRQVVRHNPEKYLKTELFRRHLPTYRRLDITTRHGYFHDFLRSVLDESGIEGLRFLTWQTYTHQHGKAEDGCWTVLTPHYDKILSSIDEVRQWCLANPETVADWSGSVYAPQDVADVAELSFATLNPNDDDCGFGQGYDLGFMFCVLKSIEHLLRRAKFTVRFGQGEYWVLYQNTLGPLNDEQPPVQVSSVIEDKVQK